MIHSRRKYRNVPTVVDGIRFDSKAEARHYRGLCWQHKLGIVRGFWRQENLNLTDPRTPKIRETYRADFLVLYAPSIVPREPDGWLEVHEVKGYWTREAKRKWKKAQALYPWIRFREFK